MFRFSTLLLLGFFTNAIIISVHGICELNCIGDEETIFKPGKAYVYKFNTVHTIERTFETFSDGNETLTISGEVELRGGQGSNRCQISLSILNWATSFPNISLAQGEQTDEHVLSTNFAEPALFSYHNGKLGKICLPEDEVWKNNIRRSIISHFQTDFVFKAGADETKDNFEVDLSGKRWTRYHKFSSSPNQLSKVSATGFILNDINGWLLKMDEQNNILDLLNKIPLESHSDIFKRNIHILKNKTILDSIQICSQDFQDKIINAVHCSESRIHTGLRIISEFETTTSLTLKQILDVNQISTELDTKKLFTSELPLDLNMDKPTSNPIVHSHFTKNLNRSELCFVDLTSTNSHKYLMYTMLMKKLIRNIPALELQKNMDFLQNSGYCGSENDGKHIQIYLEIAAMSPTDDTVEFFVDQVLSGNVQAKAFNTFLLNLASITWPGLRALKAVEKLVLNLNVIPFPVKQIDLLKSAAGLAHTYQRRFVFHSERSGGLYKGVPEHNRLINLIESSQDIERLSKIELLRDLRTLVDETENNPCSDLARDDYERLKCYTLCSTIHKEFAINLFKNDSLESGLRIRAYLSLKKCYSSFDHILLDKSPDFLKLAQSNQEVQDFVRAHILQNSNHDQISQELGVVNPSEKFPFSLKSKTFVWSEPEGNSEMKKEINIVLGSAWIPRLITAEFDVTLRNRTEQFFDLEILTSNLEGGALEVCISVRRLGITIFTKTFSISPALFSKLFLNKDINQILRSFVHKLITIWSNIAKDRHFESFRLNQLTNPTVVIPTISGLPFIQTIAIETLVSLNYTLKGMASLGNQNSDTFIHLAPNFGWIFSESSYLALGANELLGYQQISWAQWGWEKGTALRISNSKSELFTIHLIHPKDPETNETLTSSMIKFERKLQQFQFFEDSSEYHFSKMPYFSKEDSQEVSYTFFKYLDTERRVQTVNNRDTWKYTLYILESYNQDWFLTLSEPSEDEYGSRKWEIKFYPSDSLKNNTFTISASYPEDFLNLTSGHQVHFKLESPFKELGFKWNLTLQEEGSIFSGDVNYDQSHYGFEMYHQMNTTKLEQINPPPDTEARNFGKLCRYWENCQFGYDFGLIVKTTEKEVNVLEGHYGTETENKISWHAYTKGIHKYLDLALHGIFEETLTGPRPKSPMIDSWFGSIYNVSIDIENTNNLGKLHGKLSVPLQFDDIDPNDSSLDYGVSLAIEYGASKPYQSILLKSSSMLNITNIPETGRNRREIVEESSSSVSSWLSKSSKLYMVRSTQFSVLNWNYETDREEVVADNPIWPSYSSHLSTRNDEEVFGSHKFIFGTKETLETGDSSSEQSISLTYDRDWKNIKLEPLFRHIWSRVEDPTFNISSFDVKNSFKVETNGFLLFSTRLDAIREASDLKSLDFRFQTDSNDETILKFDASETQASLKTQITLAGVSYKMKNIKRATAIKNKWEYEGEYSRTPGGLYKAFGTLQLSSDSFDALDLSISETKTSNSIKVSYNKQELDDMTKYKVLVLEKAAPYFEYTSQVPKGKTSLPIKTNVMLKDHFKTEISLQKGSPSVIQFSTKLQRIKLTIVGNMTYSFDLSENPFVNVQIEATDDLNPEKLYRIESKSKLHLEGNNMFESRTTFKEPNLTSNLTILLQDISKISRPVIYIYLTNDEGEKCGLNLQSHLELYGEDSAEEGEPEQEFGISLTIERPGVTPFLTEFDLKAYQTYHSEPDDQNNNHFYVEYKYTTSFHFVYQDNVLFIAPRLNTDFKLTGDTSSLLKGTRGVVPDWTKIIINTHFKAVDVSIPELKFQSLYETDVRGDGVDHKYLGFVQKNLNKYQFEGGLSTYEGEVLHTLVETSEAPQMVGLARILKTDRHTEEGEVQIMKPRNSWTYTLLQRDVSTDETIVFVKGSHNISRSFESWNNFEAEILSDFHYGESSNFEWTDKIKLVSIQAERKLDLSSSKLFEIQTERNETFFTLKFNIFPPVHETEMLISARDIWPTTEQYTSYLTLNLKSTHLRNLKEVGVKVVHNNGNYDRTLKAHVKGMKTVVDVFVMHQKIRLEQLILFDETQATSSMKYDLMLKTGFTDDIYRYSTYTVVGELEGIAQIFHFDYSIQGGEMLNVNSSFTATSYSSQYPQIFEYKFNILDGSKSTFIYKSHVLLLRGQVPESNCKEMSETISNLAENSEFPIESKKLKKFIENKFLCNLYVDDDEYSGFREKDGRFILTSLLNVGRHDPEDYSIFVPRKSQWNKFEILWKDKKCKSRLDLYDGTTKDYSQFCYPALQNLPACWIKPIETCSGESIWNLDKPSDYRKALSYYTTVGSTLGFIVLPGILGYVGV